MAINGNIGRIIIAGLVAAATLTGCSERDLTGPDDSAQCVDYNVDFQSSGTNLSLHDIFFANNDVGWAVGQTGLILGTTDRGVTWQTQTSGHVNQLYGIHFYHPDSGWVVGADGTAMYTSDGGQHWSSETITSASLTDVFAYDRQQVWAVGDGVILSTKNGGGEWTEYESREAIPVLYRVDFVDQWHGWTVGLHEAIWRTADGGESWIPQTSGSGNPLLGLDMIDDTHGWTSGVGGEMLHTSDGQHWTIQAVPTALVIHGVAFYDSDHGMAVGDSGKVFATVDGGSHWESIVSGTTNALRQIVYINETTCLACGEAGTILRIRRVMVSCSD